MTGGNELGPGYEDLAAEDMSHGLLVALLMHHGGHYDLPLSAFETDAMGGLDGALYAIQMEPLAGGVGVRLSVRPRPDGDNAVLRWQPNDRPPAG